MTIPVFNEEYITLDNYNKLSIVLKIEVNFTPAYNRFPATCNGLPVTNIYKQITGDGEIFSIGIHLDVNGAKLIAEVIVHDLKK